ncbi:hypothetical protein ACJJID_01505 [Microbulbifer sp. CnH-101-G]|uniref:hypothetical protein n=1 Tax=Microbulbifer sp. CnH-101-G TaxID=3243393 RepID=UPI004039525B
MAVKPLFSLKFSNLHFCVLKTGSVEVSGSIPLSSTKFPLYFKGLWKKRDQFLQGAQKVHKNPRDNKKGLQALFFRLNFTLSKLPSHLIFYSRRMLNLPCLTYP